MLKMVIVDDENGQLTAMRNIFTCMKPEYEISTFQNPLLALEHLGEKPADVLLTDIRMPEMSGLELIQRVNLVCPELIKVILSGYSDFEYAQKAITCGVVEYCLKPFSHGKISALCARLEKLAAQQWAQKLGISYFLGAENAPSDAENAFNLYIEDTRRSIALCTGSEELKAFMQKTGESFSRPGVSVGLSNLRIIEQCRRYMHEKYMDDISLESMSRLFHFNPSYFSTLFKAGVGVGFTEYLTQIRMDSAARLLTETQDKVYEVAAKVGYKNAEYFIRLFGLRYGVSPQKYRHQHGPGGAYD